MNLPAPTPEYYDHAIRILDDEGWRCDTFGGYGEPKCANGILLAAAGVPIKPTTPPREYVSDEYAALVKPVAVALGLEVHTQYALEVWNDVDLICDVTRKTAPPPDHNLTSQQRATCAARFRTGLIQARESVRQ